MEGTSKLSTPEEEDNYESSSKRLLQFKKEIKKIVESCHARCRDPYYAHELFSKLARFIKMEVNQIYKSDIWDTVKKWIQEFQAQSWKEQVYGTEAINLGYDDDDHNEEHSSDEMENSCSAEANESSNSVWKQYSLMKPNETERKRLFDLFNVYINELKSKANWQVGISEILRFEEILSDLQKNHFSLLLSELWKHLFSSEKDQSAPENLNPIAPTIAIHDDFVSGEIKQCFLCTGKKTVHYKLFKQHITELHSIWWFHCIFPKCAYFTTAKRYFDAHLSSVHFVCHRCGLICDNLQQSKTHFNKEHRKSKTEDTTDGNKEKERERGKKRKVMSTEVAGSADTSSFTLQSLPPTKKVFSESTKVSTGRRSNAAQTSSSNLDNQAIEILKDFIKINRTPCKVDIVNVFNNQTGCLEPNLKVIETLDQRRSIATQTGSSSDDAFETIQVEVNNPQQNHSLISTPPSTPNVIMEKSNELVMEAWGNSTSNDFPYDLDSEIEISSTGTVNEEELYNWLK